MLLGCDWFNDIVAILVWLGWIYFDVGCLFGYCCLGAIVFCFYVSVNSVVGIVTLCFCGELLLIVLCMLLV